MVDALSRSQKYKVDLFIADKQRNPFNLEQAKKHVVIPDLNVPDICKFAENNKDQIDFALVGPEKPITEGIRDIMEKQTQIPVICPKQEYALEASKVQQRLLFQEIVPETNPRFKVFEPERFKSTAEVKIEVFNWLDELENMAVVKPDKPTAGKGVGVWGDHFKTREQLFEHFQSNFQYGTVIIEEKIDGEESSFQAFCDGTHLVPLPDTRDYKRAFDEDKGPNTGGMGSYKGKEDVLPFLGLADRRMELSIAQEIFSKWKERAKDSTALRGVPLYLAFMHTKDGIKILEDNSRPGDPEIINILPILKDDFVDICYAMVSGNLNQVRLEKAATVLTYKVPPNYGGYMEMFPNRVSKAEAESPIDLSRVYALSKKLGEKIRIYPASMESRDDQVYALKSRALGILAIGKDIEEARLLSQKGAAAVQGGGLWNRTDIASKQHIQKSIDHMKCLRRG